MAERAPAMQLLRRALAGFGRTEGKQGTAESPADPTPADQPKSSAEPGDEGAVEQVAQPERLTGGRASLRP